jgi:hypothetical protein
MVSIPLSALKTIAVKLLNVSANRVSNAFGGDTLLLDPAARLPKVKRLYELAKSKQWNYSDFEAKARDDDLSQLTVPERVAISRVMSQLYYGERGALLTSSQLAAMVPDQESSAFLTTQCFDEARHMEVFSTMANRLDQLHPINPFLQILLTDLLRTNFLIEKLIGMNLLIEGLALSVFHHMIKVFGDHPRLQGAFDRNLIVEPLEAIVRDESRHVGFGMIYLPEIAQKLSMRQKMRIKGRQLLWMALMYGSVKYHEKDAALLGIHYVDILTKILDDHGRRTEEMGLSVVLSGGKLHHLIPVFDGIINTILQQNIEVRHFEGFQAA